jgi:glycosyltransferase involved in cell wall biosynthesis
MRVVIACDWFLKYAAAQAEGLAGRGADVALLCRDHPFEFGGATDERRRVLDAARSAGVRVLEMPGRLWDASAVPALHSLRRELARLRPDVVHAHDRVDPRAVALVPRAHTVLTIHDPVPHPGQPASRLAPKRWVLEGSRNAWRARARAIIVHSEALVPEVRLRPGQRCVVIPHGLYVRDRPLTPPERPVVGVFGRLAPYKGLDVIARAMPQVWERRPDVELKVAGSGDAQLELDDPRVSIDRSYLPESAVESFFGEIRIVLLPYTQASQTGVGSVAIGFGVPIVASRLGGLPDLVADESYLVRPGNDRDLAEAILRHVDDGPPERERVLTEVARPRSWDACAAKTLEVYEQVLAEPLRRRLRARVPATGRSTR